MKTYHLLLAAVLLLNGAQAGHGMGTERIGPDKDQKHPTSEQPGWPAGMVKILRHDSRVYSSWVNGNEHFYFKATPDEIGELIELYSKIRLRDHVITIKQEKKEVRTFRGSKIDCNVNFHFVGGIARGMMRRKGEAKTDDPTLTIHVDAGADRTWLKQLAIPDNIIVNNEVVASR